MENYLIEYFAKLWPSFLILWIGIWRFQKQVSKKDEIILKLHESSKEEIKQSQDRFIGVIKESNGIHMRTTATLERLLSDVNGSVMPKLHEIHEDIRKSYKRE